MKHDPLPTLPFHHGQNTVTRTKPKFEKSVSAPSGWKVVGFYLYSGLGQCVGIWKV